MNSKIELVLRTIAETTIANESYFSELDAAVGDGDFGYSLARGYEKVLEEWSSLDGGTPGQFLMGIAKVIVGSVGGVSGTIWGTAFLRAGMSLGDRTDITGRDVVALLRSAIEGIKQRGHSEVGDKTLLDALVPAVDELERAISEGKSGDATLAAAAMAARAGAEATRPMVAKRGRASYTGERSTGTLDAGAVAVAVLFEAVRDTWPERGA